MARTEIGQPRISPYIPDRFSIRKTAMELQEVQARTRSIIARRSLTGPLSSFRRRMEKTEGINEYLPTIGRINKAMKELRIAEHEVEKIFDDKL